MQTIDNLPAIDADCQTESGIFNGCWALGSQCSKFFRGKKHHQQPFSMSWKKTIRDFCFVLELQFSILLLVWLLEHSICMKSLLFAASQGKIGCTPLRIYFCANMMEYSLSVLTSIWNLNEWCAEFCSIQCWWLTRIIIIQVNQQHPNFLVALVCVRVFQRMCWHCNNRKMEQHFSCCHPFLDWQFLASSSVYYCLWWLILHRVVLPFFSHQSRNLIIIIIISGCTCPIMITNDTCNSLNDQ